MNKKPEYKPMTTDVTATNHENQLSQDMSVWARSVSVTMTSLSYILNIALLIAMMEKDIMATAAPMKAYSIVFRAAVSC